VLSTAPKKHVQRMRFLRDLGNKLTKLIGRR
jgi:hypothetical protein